MRRLMLTALATAAVTAAGAPAARAATLTTDARCYQETQEVVVSGAGFAPLSAVTIARNGRALGTAKADVNGAFRNKIETPELPRDVRERRYRLTATDLVNDAAAIYRATRIFATFRPRRGNPGTLRVRFSVNGFGLVRNDASVYLHYVRPDGRSRRTVRLGRARGVCGKITRTRKRRLFPFRAQRGRWILQFDTRRRYSRATSRRRTPWVRKPVEIFVGRR
jgi:hypothetical protein